MNSKTLRILRNLDAAEGTIDPLDTEVNDVDLSYPVLMTGIYNLQVIDAKAEPTKDNLGTNLIIKFKTTVDARSIKGDIVPAGFVLTKRMLVTPKGKMTVEMIKKSVAKLAQGLGCSGTIRSFIDQPAAFVGRSCDFNVVVRKTTPEYPTPSNDVNDPVIKA